MLLLSILIILTLTICNSYYLRGNNIYKDEEIQPIIPCHPDILQENCNMPTIYPYPIYTEYYIICFYDTIEISHIKNVISYVNEHNNDKRNNKLYLFTYSTYYDGVSAKADIQGWCPFQ